MGESGEKNDAKTHTHTPTTATKEMKEKKSRSQRQSTNSSSNKHSGKLYYHQLPHLTSGLVEKAALVGEYMYSHNA